MAKQVGPLFITGTIGGISFYKSDGVYLARKKGGPSRQQVKTAKHFVRVRENYNEFGNCSKAGKLLRQAVNRWSAIGDSNLYRRLTQLLTKVKNEDKTSVRGARCLGKALKNESGKALLRNFDFNKDAELSKVLLKPASFNKQGQVCINDMHPAKDLVFATGTTEALLKAVCVAVNFESNEKTLHVYDEVIVHKQDKKRNLVLTPKNPAAIINAVDVDLFYFVAIEFKNVDRTKHVLCLLDVNVALNTSTAFIQKGQPLPFKMGRKVKKKMNTSTGLTLNSTAFKEAPA